MTLTMKKKFSLSLLVMMILPMIFGMITAFAAGTTITLNTNDLAQMKTVIDKASKDIANTSSTTTALGVTTLKAGSTVTPKTIIDISSGSLVFNQEVFDAAPEKERKKAMSAFVKQLQNSSVSPQGQQTTIDTMSNVSTDVKRLLIPLVMDSTSADIYTAMKWINPFLPIVRLIFGIGAICVSIFLIGSTIVDLCFIGLPLFRDGLQNKQDEKGGGGKIPFVSADAISVIKETEAALDSSGGYKNAYVIYFKRRVLTYIIISICLLYLVVGELGGLIAWLLSPGDGIVQ